MKLQSILWVIVGLTIGLSKSMAQAVVSQSRVVDAPAVAATTFLETLNTTQRQKATYSFDDAERFNWHFVPRERKGLPLKEMTPEQRNAAMAILKTGLSQQGYDKATAIIDLENVLRVIDNRPPNDTYRDPENYAFTIFGDPKADKHWSWRVEGHHLSLQFLVVDSKTIAYTPTFFGSNPGHLDYDTHMADKRMSDPRVKNLPQRGHDPLKLETQRAFDLLKTLDDNQRKKAVIATVAYHEIITGNQRNVSLDKMEGIAFADLTAAQRKLFLELLQAYLTSYRITLANQQMAKLEKTGLDKLHFAWAGDLTPELGDGKGWYYRIHGPTLLIEYDNTQSNANHIHTVVRDLTNDWGGDVLRAHYQSNNHNKP